MFAVPRRPTPSGEEAGSAQGAGTMKSRAGRPGRSRPAAPQCGQKWKWRCRRYHGDPHRCSTALQLYASQRKASLRAEHAAGPPPTGQAVADRDSHRLRPPPSLRAHRKNTPLDAPSATGSVAQPLPDRRRIPCATTPQGPGQRRPQSLRSSGGLGKRCDQRQRQSGKIAVARRACSSRTGRPARRGSMATAPASSAQSAYWPRPVRRCAGRSKQLGGKRVQHRQQLPRCRCRWLGGSAARGWSADRSSPSKSPPDQR